jgi:hypothetical protein
MPGKLIELAKRQSLYVNADLVTAGTYYNGSVTATPGLAIDTELYDQMIITTDVHSVGTYSSTIALSLIEHDSDAPGSASAVASSSFTTYQDGTIEHEIAQIDLTKRKRYIWLQGVKAGTATAVFAANALLFKAKNAPVTQTTGPKFDI